MTIVMAAVMAVVIEVVMGGSNGCSNDCSNGGSDSVPCTQTSSGNISSYIGYILALGGRRGAVCN